MILAQLAIILGAILTAWIACLVAARIGVLSITLRRPPKPKPEAKP